jgi:hypothetical protein
LQNRTIFSTGRKKKKMASCRIEQFFQQAERKKKNNKCSHGKVKQS